MNFNNRKLLLACATCALLSGLFSFFIAQNFYQNKELANSQPPKNLSANQCDMKKIVAKNYKFIKPILILERSCESENLFPLKTQLSDLISTMQTNSELDFASAFVIDMNRSEWIGVNENVGYLPGSLIKVPLAISLMKMVEDKKCNLTDKIEAPKELFNIHQTYTSETIKPGETYTIEQLLKYSLAFSDNNATQILNHKVDLNYFKRLFQDLSLTEPDVHDMTYTISAKDYSRFIRVLFNGTYLYKRHSEQLLEMMSKSSFKDGIAASIDKNKAYLANKFGESAMNGEHHFHESGIIYINNSAYLITVMTKGKDVVKLSSSLKSIAKLVYNQMTSGSLNTSVAKL